MNKLKVIESVEEKILLEDILSDVSFKNLHSETDWAQDRGNEAW